MRRFVFLVPLFVIVSVGGFSLGISFPQEAKAQAGISLDVFPGDQSDGWAYMTCGWHDVCEWPYSGSNALDWGNQADWNVMWRSRGLRPGVDWIIATAYPTWWPTNCANVDVDVYDVNGYYRGWARYTHSDRPQDSFYVWGNSGWYYQANYAAKTIAVANEIPGCSTTGAHLHQTAAYYWTRNGGAFPNAPTAEWRWVWDHPMHWTGW